MSRGKFQNNNHLFGLSLDKTCGENPVTVLRFNGSSTFISGVRTCLLIIVVIHFGYRLISFQIRK